MSVIASCGCLLTEAEGLGKNITYKDYSAGKRVVRFALFCNCYDRYEKVGLILTSKQQENDWLTGKLRYNKK